MYTIEELARELDSPRLAELIFPLIVSAPSATENIVNYAKRLYQSRLSELSLSEEAEVLSAILVCHDYGEIEKGKITVKDVRAVVNETLDLEERRSSSHIGRVINRLGFDRCKVHGGYAALFWNQELIDRFRRDPRYKQVFQERETRAKLHEQYALTTPEIPHQPHQSNQPHPKNWIKEAFEKKDEMSK